MAPLQLSRFNFTYKSWDKIPAVASGRGAKARSQQQVRIRVKRIVKATFSGLLCYGRSNRHHHGLDEVGCRVCGELVGNGVKAAPILLSSQGIAEFKPRRVTRAAERGPPGSLRHRICRNQRDQRYQDKKTCQKRGRHILHRSLLELPVLYTLTF